MTGPDQGAFLLAGGSSGAPIHPTAGRRDFTGGMAGRATKASENRTPLVAALVRLRVRRLKGAASAVLRTLAVAAAIALILLVLELLVGVILVEADTLFR